MQRIVLASASPRRKELLAQIGLKFDVIPFDSDEVFDKEKPIEDSIQKIAYNKAAGVASGLSGDFVVIGADTVVSIDGRILGKPADAAEAAAMLRDLSGRTHSVYTGFAVIKKSGDIAYTDYAKTLVTFRRLEEEEISAYITTGEPLDKAGAYGVQGMGAVFVEKIEGDYSNVVGLPLCRLYGVLKKLDIISVDGSK